MPPHSSSRHFASNSYSLLTAPSEGDEESLIGAAHAESPVVAEVQIPYWQQLYYWGALRYIPATLFSLGKVAQAAGQDVLGITHFLEDIPSTDPRVNNTVLAVLVGINLFINLSTRANKIFEYCLLNNVYWVNQLSDIPANVDISKSYVIEANTQTLYKVNVDSTKRAKLSLSQSGSEKLKGFCDLIRREIVSSLPETDASQPLLVSQYFNAHHHHQLSKVLQKAGLPQDWHWQAKTAYTLLYGFCAASTFFSATSAYLSGVTLVQQVDKGLSDEWQIGIGSYVTVCAVVAYISFNVDTMQRFVTRACTSLNEGLYKGDFGIPGKVMLSTIGMTLFGIIAGTGMAYFSTQHSADVFPWIKTWQEQEKEVLIFTGVFLSLFPSIFNFAAGCYNQLLTASEARKAPQPKQMTAVTAFIATLILIDSIAISFGTFIGLRDLLERAFNPSQSTASSHMILGFTALACLSNTWLNFGMTMTGTEDTFKKWNDYVYGSSCEAQYQPLLAEQQSSALVAPNDPVGEALRSFTPPVTPCLNAHPYGNDSTNLLAVVGHA